MANNLLREKLDSHGIRQVDIAKKSGLAIGTINKVSTKKKTPSPATRSKIVQALNDLSNSSYTVEEIFLNPKK
jgi:transcriptional regulator with XRE-family HTH domain